MKHCPNCKDPIPLLMEDLDDGEIFFCSFCGAEIVVTFLDGGGFVLELLDDIDSEFVGEE